MLPGSCPMHPLQEILGIGPHPLQKKRKFPKPLSIQPLHIVEDGGLIRYTGRIRYT